MWPIISKEEYIDIVAPSGKADPSDINAISDYLIREGFKPRIPQNILGEHIFSANIDEMRFEHLKNSLQAEDSTLIWCVRGGHGVTNLMPELTKLLKPTKQKLLVGFSDITSLHLWLNQVWYWPSLHGPMARMTALGKIDDRDVKALHRLWFEGLKGYEILDLQALNSYAKEIKVCEGVGVGTCLSILQASIGTPWGIDGNNKILFIEDINEHAYRIHRSLIHLVNAGVFNEAKALVLGDFGEDEQETTEMVLGLQDFANNYLPKQGIHLPVFRLKGFGHGKRNYPLPLGVTATLIKNASHWKLIF